MSKEDELAEHLEGLNPAIQIVEIDVFKGAGAILQGIAQMKAQPLDQEWDEKLKYMVDVCNNCLHQFWQAQAIRLALHKSIAEDNLELFNADESVKH